MGIPLEKSLWNPLEGLWDSWDSWEWEFSLEIFSLEKFLWDAPKGLRGGVWDSREWEFPGKNAKIHKFQPPKNTPLLFPALPRARILGFFPGFFCHLLVAEGSQFLVAQGQDPRALVGDLPMDLVVVAGTLG